MNENKLGSIISRLRKEKDITQKDLAKALNISDKAISRWECGSSQPSLEMIFQISRYFNVSFNDLITARLSVDSEDNEIVENIIKEFQEIGKKKAKIIKLCLLFAVILLLILTLAFIFTNTYNRFKVYKVHIESDVVEPIYGTYVETNVRDVLQLGDIKLKNISLEDTDTISIDLYIIENNEEKILKNYSSLKNIYFHGSQSYIDIENLSKYFDNVYLRITITDSKNNIEEYNVKLEFVLDFTNNKINYDDNFNTESLDYMIMDYSDIDVKGILLENGFEETGKNIIRKTIDEYKISYSDSKKVINVNFEQNSFSYRYIYSLSNNILEVIVFSDNSTEIENYKYDVANNTMDCTTGSCNDYKNAMKLLDEKVLNLLK